MGDGSIKMTNLVNLMNQRGLHGLVIFSDGTCSIVRPSYLYYFSEFKPLGPRNAVVVSNSGDSALLVEPTWDSHRALRESWIRDVRGSSDFLKDLMNLIREFKIKGPVGLVGSKDMIDDLYMGIQKGVNITLADDIVEDIARQKTDDDLTIDRKAAGIADVGFNAFLEYTRTGTLEYELVAYMEFAMRSAGADDIFILLSSGKHNTEMHHPGDRRMREGDIVIAEITSVYKWQFIQLCRTVVLGRPSPVLTEKYNMLTRAFEESQKEIKPGALASMVPRAMNKIISDAGYGEYCRPPYMRARGHGTGIGPIVAGVALDDNVGVPLASGQVLVVHPNQYLPETGYLACGETFLVTDSGTERLAKTETKLYINEG
jgi:Xaa-Pro dipeptidase